MLTAVKVAALGAVLAPGICVAQSKLRLPNFGDSSASAFSAVDEARLGEAFLREILASTEALHDPEIEEYVSDVGFRLVQASDGASMPFTFVVLNDPLVNAFAGPTGVIGVNSGLLLAAGTESEFAAVVAHEVAHVTQRHLARGFELNDRSSIPTMAGILAALVLASQSSEAGQAALATVVGGRAQAQIDSIRANELEADRIGIEILARAKFDPRAMAGFFEQLQSAQRYFRLPPEFLATHPVTTSRIAESRERAEQHRYKQFEDSLAFAFAQAKLTVLTLGGKKALEQFDTAVRQGAGSFPQAQRYGRALALMALERWKLALKDITALAASNPLALGVLDANARVLAALGRGKESEALYRGALRVYLHDRICTFGLGELLIGEGRPEEAARLLSTYLSRNPRDAYGHRLLAQALAKLGQASASYAALAENQYHLGQLGTAIGHLEHAQRADDGDYFLASKINARLRVLRDEHIARRQQ